MFEHKLIDQQSSHHFIIESGHGESSTRRVIILTVVMMVIEIASGMLFGSMALLADGWHMGTHAAALGITLFAYRYTRKHINNPEYSFGPGKVGSLGGFTSAIVLALVALLMVIESVERFFAPIQIHFYEAIAVAVVGLVVNLVSAFWLGGHHHHDTDDHHHEHDHNLKAAYAHVLADALTSVMAIMALLMGKVLGWWWMDPLIGIVGAVIILKWAYGLAADTSTLLLDRSHDNNREVQKVLEALEEQGKAEVKDIHLWRLSPAHFALMATLKTNHPQPPDYYKKISLDVVPQIDHITIEVTVQEDDQDCG